MKRSEGILLALVGAGFGTVLSFVLMAPGIMKGNDRMIKIWATMTLPSMAGGCAVTAVLAPLVTRGFINGQIKTMVALSQPQNTEAVD